MTTALSQLQQELQNELNTANQLLDLISNEVMEIKELTRPGGEFETKVKFNADLMERIAKLTKINISSKQMEVDLANNN